MGVYGKWPNSPQITVKCYLFFVETVQDTTLPNNNHLLVHLLLFIFVETVQDIWGYVGAFIGSQLMQLLHPY